MWGEKQRGGTYVEGVVHQREGRAHEASKRGYLEEKGGSLRTGHKMGKGTTSKEDL